MACTTAWGTATQSAHNRHSQQHSQGHTISIQHIICLALLHAASLCLTLLLSVSLCLTLQRSLLCGCIVLCRVHQPDAVWVHRYCQGMNFVCGFLLIVLDDELDVFCCLVALVQKLVPGYLHTVIPLTWLAAHPPYRGLLIPDTP